MIGKPNGGNGIRVEVKSAVLSTLNLPCPGPGLVPGEGTQLIHRRSNAWRRTLSIFACLPFFLCVFQEQCMNNRIVCVLQENANILRKYIWYYRYKQGI